MNRECVTCHKLGNCGQTDEEKILNHYVCDKFQEVENQEIITARCDIINRYGTVGLKVLVVPEKESPR